MAVLRGLPTPACSSVQAHWVRRGPTAVCQRCFRSLGGSLAAAGPGYIWDRLTRTAARTAGTDRPPRFLGNPKVTAPTSKDPGGTALPGRDRTAGAAPTCAHGRGSHDET